jgi:hypothetical protein
MLDGTPGQLDMIEVKREGMEDLWAVGTLVALHV